MRQISRREFIVGAASAAVLAACSSGDDTSAPTTTSTRALGPTTTRRAPALPGDPFGLGVASGDPQAESVILWARLAPNPLADDGRGGMPGDPVDVIWEVATDDRFTKLATRGVATAEPDAGHSLHVEAEALDPATEYFYRFTVASGRARSAAPARSRRRMTHPSGSRSPSRTARCSTRDATARTATWSTRTSIWSCISVTTSTSIRVRARCPTRVPESLADFRLRYACYRSDPDLQAAHARFPFVCTWDDHEVLNNYMGDNVLDGRPAEQVRELRRRRTARGGSTSPFGFRHRRVRQCRCTGTSTSVILPGCTCSTRASMPTFRRVATAARPRTSATATRESQIAACSAPTRSNGSPKATSASAARWNVVGNPVVLSGIDGGTDASAYYLDSWDGFPEARLRLLDALAGIDNPVILTGDYHAGMVLDAHRRPFEPDSDVVATEFLSPPISSVLFPADVTARTPQLRQQINAHGYLTVTVERDRLTAAFRVLDDVADADSAVRTEATWQVDAGTPRAVTRS